MFLYVQINLNIFVAYLRLQGLFALYKGTGDNRSRIAPAICSNLVELDTRSGNIPDRISVPAVGRY